MSEQVKETGLARRESSAISRWRMLPASLGEAMEMATMIANSDLCPKAYRGKPADCIICYEYGSSLGLSWMQALRSISVINGQGSLWGDAVPALILGSGDCERFNEVYTGTAFEDSYTAVCTMKRRGLPDETVVTFSVADAKKANLWGKQGPWTQYPARMLKMRARGFCARDTFADKLSGLVIAEEAMDYPDAIDTHAVSVEEVVKPVDLMEKVPEGQRDTVEKAFEALNFAPGQRLAKLNEHLGSADVTGEDGTAALLTWCRDEYAKRKTGKPMKAKDSTNGNAKPKAESKQADAVTAAELSHGEHQSPAHAQKSSPAPVVAPQEVKEAELMPEAPSVDEIPFGNQGQNKTGEWF